MRKTLILALLLLSVTFLSPLFASSVNASSNVYVVVNVAADDVLNLRSGPGVRNPILATLPHNGRGVIALGQERRLDNSTWAKVVWAGNQGWVNKRYLRLDTNSASTPALAAENLILQCSGASPYWRINITERQLHINVAEGLRYHVPVDFRMQSVNDNSIAVVSGKQQHNYATAVLQKVEACATTLRGQNQPYTITAVLNNSRVLSGCCTLSSR